MVDLIQFLIKANLLKDLSTFRNWDRQNEKKPKQNADLKKNLVKVFGLLFTCHSWYLEGSEFNNNLGRR